MKHTQIIRLVCSRIPFKTNDMFVRLRCLVIPLFTKTLTVNLKMVSTCMYPNLIHVYSLKIRSLRNTQNFIDGRPYTSEQFSSGTTPPPKKKNKKGKKKMYPMGF